MTDHPEPLSDLLARIDALAAKATREPWVIDTGVYPSPDGDDDRAFARGPMAKRAEGDGWDGPWRQQAKADAAYIGAISPDVWQRVSEALRAAQRTADIRRRMIDIPTKWELTNATPQNQHHDKCSYRVGKGGFLCDCAAMRVMERVSRLMRAAEARAEQAEAEVARHAAAAAIIFQPGGRYHDRVMPEMWGKSTVVEGIKWLDAQLQAAEAEVARLREALAREMGI